MKMKKLLAVMALAISMPTMAQTMYDGRSCQDWKNEFSMEVDRLKSEIKTLQLNAKTSGDSRKSARRRLLSQRPSIT